MQVSDMATSSSQSPGLEPPGSRKVPHRKVLSEFEQFALQKYLNLKEVMPSLINKKVMPSAKVGTALAAKNEVVKFLGFLKKRSAEDFVIFLEALQESFPVNEDHRTLVNIMGSMLRNVDLPSGSVLRERIETVVEAAAKHKDVQTPVPSTVIPTSHMMPPAAGMATGIEQTTQTSISRPPKGFVPPGRTQHFTREEGGTFYCPAHDITIFIPPASSPPDVLKFAISMHAYVKGPFKIPDDIEPCMPVIWLCVYPSFKFKEQVTLKIPHSAVIEDEDDFCLLRAEEDPASSVYEFSEQLKADFSDDYHVVVNLDHFCAVTGGCKKKTSSKRKRKTGSGRRVHKRSSQQASRSSQRQRFAQGAQLTSPELVRQCSSTSSTGSITPQSSLTSSFGSSFDSHTPSLPLSQLSLSESSNPQYFCYQSQDYQSHSQTERVVEVDTETCFHSNPIPARTSSLDPDQSQKGTQTRALTQSPACSQTPSHSQSSNVRRQEAFDEDSSCGMLFEHQASAEGYASCNKMCMAKCTLQKRAERWDVVFLASCSHPTGMLALCQMCERISSGGTNTTCISKLFRPTSENLEFEPSLWEEGGWKVSTTSNPQFVQCEDAENSNDEFAVTVWKNSNIVGHIVGKSLLVVPTEEWQQDNLLFQCTWRQEAITKSRLDWISVEAVCCLSEDQLRQMNNVGLYPPQLSYLVDGTSASVSRDCKILVRGADISGQDLYFVLALDNSSKPNSESTRKLETWSQLYPEGSELRHALSGNGLPTDCFHLDPEVPDHIKFLADISFQLTYEDLNRLPSLLDIPSSKVDQINTAAPNDLVEQVYQMLLFYVALQCPVFNKFISILKRVGIAEVELVSKGKKQFEIDSGVDMKMITDAAFVRTVGQKIATTWKYVARFLGLSDTTLDNIQHAADPPTLCEQAFQMVYSWQREEGNKATYGALLRALHRVWEHEPSKISGAFTYSLHHVHNLACASLQ